MYKIINYDSALNERRSEGKTPFLSRLSPPSYRSSSRAQEVEVEREDQMRINLFARKNARLLDIREKITEKEVREPRF